MIRNVSGQGVYLRAVKTADGAAITSGVTATVSMDGGAAAASANAPSHIGGGVWWLALSRAETDAAAIAATPAATGLLPDPVVIATLDATVGSRATIANQTTMASAIAGVDAAIAALNDYDGADTSGVTALLARLTSARAAKLDRDLAAVGSEMTLSDAGATAAAAALEAAMINDGDGQALIDALVQGIGNVNVDEVALVALIRADIERGGGILKLLSDRASELRLAKLDRDLAAVADLPPDPPDVSNLPTLDEIAGRIETDHGAGSYVDTGGGGDSGGGGGATAQELLDAITAAGASISVVSPVDVAGGDTLTIVRGDAYLDAMGTAIRVTVVDSRLPAALDSDGTAVSLRIGRFTVDGDVVAAAGEVVTWTAGTSTAVLAFELTAAQTAALVPGVGYYRYDIQWLLQGDADQPMSSSVNKPVAVERDQR